MQKKTVNIKINADEKLSQVVNLSSSSATNHFGSVLQHQQWGSVRFLENIWMVNYVHTKRLL